MAKVLVEYYNKSRLYYLLPARRPYNSRLSNAKLKKVLSDMAFTGQYPHWREQVEAYVTDYVQTSLKS